MLGLLNLILILRRNNKLHGYWGKYGDGWIFMLPLGNILLFLESFCNVSIKIKFDIQKMP